MGNMLLSGEVSTGSTDTVLAAMDTVMSFGAKVLNFAVTNPVLCFCLACGLAGAGIAVIAKVKHFAISS